MKDETPGQHLKRLIETHGTGDEEYEIIAAKLVSTAKPDVVARMIYENMGKPGWMRDIRPPHAA